MKTQPVLRNDDEVKDFLGHDGEFKTDIAEITGEELSLEAETADDDLVATPKRQRMVGFICVLCLVMTIGLGGLSILPLPDRIEPLPERIGILPESSSPHRLELVPDPPHLPNCLGRERYIPYFDLEATHMIYIVEEYWVPDVSLCPGDFGEGIRIAVRSIFY